MSQNHPTGSLAGFAELGLIEPLLQGLKQAGYLEPTPIQASIIPHIMTGRDVIGQAQTGTGKTAAFALPLLNRLRTTGKAVPTILVLVPTRELATQVSESFVGYGAHLKRLQVLPVFGGQEYTGQLQQLDRGVHVVVGTPGRVMDHIRRGSFKLSGIRSIVLDEADEMLKMGFLEDVQWILDQVPQQRQIALFSATMPASIRAVAATYLDDPVEIALQEETATAPTIEQHYLFTSGIAAKRQMLATILEAEPTDGVLIFVRTRIQTVELAEYLDQRGYAVAALNGDIVQSQRLRTVEQLKNGKLDILVATDVAARGLDVERVSHVINFDAPFDPENYIHRIGRTGRAGRQGRAILFLGPRERGLLKSIERTTRRKIAPLQLPTAADINVRRIAEYKKRISQTLATDCSFFAGLITDYCREHQTSPETVAAALAKMAQGKTPLLLPENDRCSQRPPKGKGKTSERQSQQGPPRRRPLPRQQARKPLTVPPEEGMERYIIEIGESHGAKPGNIVGAIANEAEINSAYIGRIDIFADYSTVDLPYGMPGQILRTLQKARINGRMMRTRLDDSLSTDPALKNEAPADEAEAGRRARKGKAPKMRGRQRTKRPAATAANPNGR